MSYVATKFQHQLKLTWLSCLEKSLADGVVDIALKTFIEKGTDKTLELLAIILFYQHLTVFSSEYNDITRNSSLSHLLGISTSCT